MQSAKRAGHGVVHIKPIIVTAACRKKAEPGSELSATTFELALMKLDGTGPALEEILSNSPD